MNPEPSETVNGYWMPTIVIEEVVSFDREIILGHLRKITSMAVYFWPLSTLPMFEEKPENL